MEYTRNMNTTNNMNEFEHKLAQLRDISLSEEERQEMRRHIRAFMTEHPVQRPFLERLFNGIGAPRSNSFMRPALAGFLIVSVLGGGASFTAADALPGDLLYPFKIHVNENIQQVLAITTKAKADQSAVLAVRRIEEAEALASEGRLTPEVRADIETRFNEHVARFEARAMALAEKDANIEGVADVQSDLEASLRAHATILSDLSIALPEGRLELSRIASAVSDRVRSVQSARVSIEETISVKVGEGIRTAATAKQRAVERELQSARPRVAAQPEVQADSAVMMMSVTAAKIVSTTTDPVVDAFEKGSERLEEGQYGEAFRTLQAAVRAIKQEKLELDTRVRLKLELNVGVTPLGNGSIETEVSNDVEVETSVPAVSL